MRAILERGDWARRGLGRASPDACVDAAQADVFIDLALVATLAGEPLYRA